jgi:hypothetical protein
LKGLKLLLGGDFGLWARLPGLLGDLLCAGFIYLIVERRSRSRAALLASADALRSSRLGFLAGLSWALNPLAALVSAGHGQFDSLALGLMLAAAWWLEYGADAASEGRAALALAAAVALKTWPLAFVPLYLGVFATRREAARFAAWVFLPPLALLLPWLWWDGLSAVLARLNETGSTALGFSAALRACFFAVGAPIALWHRADELWRALALFGLGLAWIFLFARARRLGLLDALAWVALGLMILAPGLPPQALVWPAAFLALGGAAPVLRYSAATLPLLLAFDALFLPAVLAGTTAWSPPRLPAWALLLWAAANLGWWADCLYGWLRLWHFNLPARRQRLFR